MSLYSLLQEVAAPVGCLDFGADRVSERHLCHFDFMNSTRLGRLITLLYASWSLSMPFSSGAAMYSPSFRNTSAPLVAASSSPISVQWAGLTLLRVAGLKLIVFARCCRFSADEKPRTEERLP